MMASSTETLIADYLDRLRRASVDLPVDVRTELLDDIRAHLADTVDASAGEAEVRRALDELGTPEEIAAAAAAESGTQSAGRTGGDQAYDVVAVLVLLIGGFVIPVLGWIAGVVMLWNGPRWTVREKWTGTLIWPIAIIVGVGGLFAAHVTAGGLVVVVPVAAIIALAILIVGFTHLLRAARS